MRRYGFAILLALAINLSSGRAQAPLPPYEFSVAPGTTLANCVVVPNQTTWCWTGDGNTYKSVNGGPFVSDIPAFAGITAITVNGGTPLTGPTVALTIPSKASSTTTTTIQ